MSNEENVKEEEMTVDTAESQDAPEQSTAEPQAESASENYADVSADEPTKAKAPEKAQKPEKPAKARNTSTKSAAEKRKLFKLVYYPILAVFVALMLVFSIVDGVYGYNPNAYGDGYYKAVNTHIAELSQAARSSMSASDSAGNPIGIAYAREYILKTLKEGKFNEVEERKPEVEDDEKEVTDTDWYRIAGAEEPTVTLHTSALTADLQQRIGADKYLVGTEITNIIAAIPSRRANAKSIIITVRYDSRTDTNGAAQNASFVATVMQSLIEYAKAGTTFKNDLIVVFTEDLDYAYGAYAFFDSFVGLNDAVVRAKVGISLDAYGNAGTLALTDASGAGFDYMNAYTKISGSVFNSSVVPDSIADELINKHSVAAFGKIPALQVAVLGGLDAAQSTLDTADNISQSIVHQQAQFVKAYIDEFANTSDSFKANASGELVFFSYLDGGTVAYTKVAAYVIGALILAAIAGVIVAMILKKTFSLKKMFVALGVELLVVASTLIAMFAAYFLVTLMLTGFGVLPIHAITELRYFNAGILIAAMFVTLAAAFGFTTLYKKLFRVTSSEVVRGTAMLFGVAGAVMSFAAPEYSFMTSWLGLLMVLVLLASVLLHKMFKAKFGMGMDQLYLYAVPVALCLPLIMPQVSILMWLLPLTLMPVYMTVFTALLGIAVPYLDRTRVVFDKVAKKLPKRTIRVERVVTEKVEDRAKKGKFTEKTFKRVEKEKVAINYKNYFGVCVIAVLGVVIALFSGGFGVDFDKTLTGYHTYDQAIYNNALVYEWEKTGSGEAVQRIVVDDLMAYKFIRYSINDLEWDSENGRYSKNVHYNWQDIISEPTIEKSGDAYRVKTFDGARSNVTITIPSARAVTKITVKQLSKVDGDYEGYFYEFNRQESIVLRMPYGFGDFTLEFETTGSNPTKFEYEEHRYVSANGADGALDNVDEWNRVRGDYIGTDTGKGLRGGIVVKCTISL
ncbi:MAG: M28 family peptidase [Clostridiales bacterium]|nr:M28 family peptidase [Clostridiales bacterium]